MATRFSASEARKKAESAQKSLEEQRKRNEELKKILAKERTLIKQGYEKQRSKIISAAIDGETEITVDSIYLYTDLLNVGIQVVESGRVKQQLQKPEKILGEVEREEIREEILEQFDIFIDGAKDDLKRYYGGLQRFHRLNYYALTRVIDSDWIWDEFCGDEVYCDEVTDDLKSKYADYIEKINEKIKEYKEFSEDANFEEEEYEDLDHLINGEYFFGSSNDEVDLLKPSEEGNRLIIRWKAEEGATYMNSPLLSDAGLAWLSSYRGQSLIESIFESLSSAAEMGKTFLKLDFTLTKEGWSFVNGRKNVFCCMPDELVEIIARENFTIDDTKSTQKSYSIKVSW